MPPPFSALIRRPMRPRLRPLAAGLFVPLAAAALATAALAGCDDAPGRAASTGRLPVVSSVSVTPADLVVEDLPASDVTPSTVRVRLSVAATARDAEGALTRVSYAVFPVGGGAVPVVAQTLRAAGGDRFTADTTLTLPRTGLGTYTVRLFAIDGDGLLGEGQARITLRSRNRAPVVASGVAAPNPYPGTGPLVLTAVASDPDGLTDVDRVDATFSGQSFRLFDDGRTSGDPIAGDGRFTGTILFADRPAAGSYPVSFVATDRAGVRSAAVTTALVVQ